MIPRRRLSRGLPHLIVAILALAPPVAAATQPPQELSKFERERARMMLKIVRSDLEKFYYDPAYHGVQLDEAFRTAEDRIAQASSISQLFAGIARPLLELKDSHTFFVPPGRSAHIHFGWLMQTVGEHCFVTAVQKESDAEAKGLETGDRILAIDGTRPTRENVWGINYVYRVLAPRPAYTLAVQRPGAEPRRIEVNAKIEQQKKLVSLMNTFDVGDFIREDQESAFLVRHRFVDYEGDLLIWKMPRFDLSPSEVENHMRKVRNHKALILDLRGNPGGAVETLERMVGAFLGDKVKIGDVKSRSEIKPVVSKKAGDVYEGKVVVLVDSNSGSAAELFARMMQLSARATVIGDRTGGFVMMSRSHDHMVGDSSGIFFYTSITVADIIMPDGKSLERLGVTPDPVMLPTAEDLAAGRDPVLSHAASLCGVTLSPEKAGGLFPVEWKK